MLKTPASLTENVKIAYLPSPDASCQKLGNNLVVSGWGRSIIWIYDQNGVSKFQFFRDNRFLWAVKQQCLDITQCENYEGDQKDALCVGDLSESRNSAYKGDSGGKSSWKSIIIMNHESNSYFSLRYLVIKLLSFINFKVR